MRTTATGLAAACVASMLVAAGCGHAPSTTRVVVVNAGAVASAVCGGSSQTPAQSGPLPDGCRLQVEVVAPPTYRAERDGDAFVVSNHAPFEIRVRLTGAPLQTARVSGMNVSDDPAAPGLHFQVSRSAGGAAVLALSRVGQGWDARAARYNVSFAASLPSAERWDAADHLRTRAAESRPAAGGRSAAEAAAESVSLELGPSNEPGAYRVECAYVSAGDGVRQGDVRAAPVQLIVRDDGPPGPGPSKR